MTQYQLFCPTTKSALHPADKDLVDAVNAWLNTTHHTEDFEAKPLLELLVDEQMNIAYPVNAGIPQLLPEHGISLMGLNGGNTVE